MRIVPTMAAGVFLAGLAVALAAAAPTPAAAEGGFAVIYNGTKKDGAFNESAFEGVQRAREELGIRARDRVTADAGETEKALRTFAENGVENLLTVGFANTDAVAAVAKDFPDTRFTLVDGVVDLPNVKSILFAEDEAGYLAGVAAGLKTETGKLGFIGGMPIPPVDKYGCGFLQGARSVNPDVMVAWAYVGDSGTAFRDIEGAMRIAEAMIADEIDVVFPAAGLAGNGAIDAAHAAGKYAIGVDVNQNPMQPGTVLTSAVKRVDEAVVRSWQAVRQGDWTGGVSRLGVAEGGVDWAVDQHNAGLVSDIEAEIAAVREQLASGAITIAAPAAVAGCGG